MGLLSAVKTKHCPEAILQAITEKGEDAIIKYTVPCSGQLWEQVFQMPIVLRLQLLLVLHFHQVTILLYRHQLHGIQSKVPDVTSVNSFLTSHNVLNIVSMHELTEHRTSRTA